jgi:hypothetical protein
VVSLAGPLNSDCLNCIADVFGQSCSAQCSVQWLEGLLTGGQQAQEPGRNEGQGGASMVDAFFATRATESAGFSCSSLLFFSLLGSVPLFNWINWIPGSIGSPPFILSTSPPAQEATPSSSPT